MKNVAIIGYSGHSYVVIDVVQLLGYNIIGYFEKKEVENNPFELKYLGDERLFEFNDDICCIIAIGDNTIRYKIYNYLIEKKVNILSLIHPKANVSNLSMIKEGTVVFQGASINAFANIGKGVIINTSSVVEHECVVGDFSHIAPSAVLAGNVKVGTNTFIGANSVIKQGISIGNNVIIGAGSVVLKDISDNTTWVGNPAKRINK